MVKSAAISPPSLDLTVDPPRYPRPQLDRNIRLKDILDTFPKSVFVKNPLKAWGGFFINIALVSLGWWGISVAPWYLLAPLWIFTGTGFFGLFIIAHDCGHRSFANRKWVNNLVGHIALIPCIYPFHPWRIQHNLHHKWTNNLDIDNTWNPFSLEKFENSPQWQQLLYRSVRGKLWWTGSIIHWAHQHFRWGQFEGKERQQFRFSVLFVVAVIAIGAPLLIATTGVWGLVKLWFVPWMVFHFWLSTITLFHHTLPENPFDPSDRWHEAGAQLMGSVHCKYPWWFEFICHDINVHVPHHVCSAIPWYNLRQAHASLEEHWGAYIVKREFSWSLIQEVTATCHLYDRDTGYFPFPRGVQGDRSHSG